MIIDNYRAAKIPHDFKQISLSKGDQLSEEFTKAQPFQTVSLTIYISVN